MDPLFRKYSPVSVIPSSRCVLAQRVDDVTFVGEEHHIEFEFFDGLVLVFFFEANVRFELPAVGPEIISVRGLDTDSSHFEVGEIEPVFVLRMDRLLMNLFVVPA